MRLLRRSTGGGEVVELIFGVGLVGAAVVEASRLLPDSRLLEDRLIETKWEDLRASLTQVWAALGHPARVRLFWCAGRTGFGSDAAQCDAELKCFEAVLAWAEGLSGLLEFHLTSSAGGLHEGQVRVASADAVSTARPYAALKLAQEQALAASTLATCFVYRLSSVYGVPVPERRLGLISTLVLNALRHRPTTITADASTLRDFVSAADVGHFMAREEKAKGLHYLVSGQPLSVWALQLAVQRALHRPVRVVYSVRKDNVASTSFSPSLRPTLWESSSVESNLPLIASAAQSWAAAPKSAQEKRQASRDQGA